MERNIPRAGSLCLPNGFQSERWRLILVLLAMALGASAGLWFHLVFGGVAEAIAIGLTCADIALHIVDPLVNMLGLAPLGCPATTETVRQDLPATPWMLRLRCATKRGKDNVNRFFRSLTVTAKQAANEVRDFIRRFFGGFGGSAAFAVGTY